LPLPPHIEKEAKAVLESVKTDYGATGQTLRLRRDRGSDEYLFHWSPSVGWYPVKESHIDETITKTMDYHA
jgi:hypothetical protein